MSRLQSSSYRSSAVQQTDSGRCGELGCDSSAEILSSQVVRTQVRENLLERGRDNFGAAHWRGSLELTARATRSSTENIAVKLRVTDTLLNQFNFKFVIFSFFKKIGCDSRRAFQVEFHQPALVWSLIARIVRLRQHASVAAGPTYFSRD